MAEITLDQDQIIESVNRRITKDLAAAIKQVAKDGVWEDAEEDDGVDPEKIIADKAACNIQAKWAF